MSSMLVQHVKVLAVGVTLIVMTLAMAPGVANAETKLDGKVDAAVKGGGGADKGDGSDANKGDGGIGVSHDGKVDGALNGNGASNNGDGGRADKLVGEAEGGLRGEARSNLGDTNLASDTKTDQRLDLNEPPLLGGDTKSINEVNSDLVPAKGDAKADGELVVDGVVDEGFCVRGALNQNASGCGGGGGVGNGDGAATAPSLDVGPNEILGNTTVESATDTGQRVDLNNPPLLGGDTTTINEVNSDLVPARGNADVDAVAEVDGLLREQACGRGALNQDAGGCSNSGTGGVDNGNNNGINLGEPLADLDNTTLDSATTIGENLNPTNDPTLDGAAKNRNDIKAPIVPASGTVKVDGDGAVDNMLEHAVNSCTTLNAADCGGSDTSSAPGSSGPGGIDLGEPLADLDETMVGSATDIAETLDPDGPTLNGTVDNDNDIEVPLPVSGTVEAGANTALGDTLEQSVDSCTDVNASGCGDGNTAPPGSSGPGGIDLGDPLADLDNTTLDSATDTDENLNPTNNPVLGGTVDNTNTIVAPAVPASAKADLDANLIAPNLVQSAVNSCTALNAGPCGANTAPPDDGGPGDGESGNGGPGDGDPAIGGPAGGPGDGGPGDGGPGDGGPAGGGLGDGGPSDGGSEDSDSSNPNNSDSPDDSGGSNPDASSELAFAAPADSTDSSGGSGSANNSDEPGSAANPFKRESQTLADDSSGSRLQTLAANPSSGRTFVALSAGPSENREKASASSGSKTKSGELPDTGGITPLVLVAGLLFIGSGLFLLVTKRRRRFDS